MPSPTPVLGLQAALASDLNPAYLTASLAASLTTLDGLFSSAGGLITLVNPYTQPIIATPTTLPPVGAMRIYPKADEQYYKVNSMGVETPIAPPGLTIPLSQHLTWTADNLYDVGDAVNRPRTIYATKALEMMTPTGQPYPQLNVYTPGSDATNYQRLQMTTNIIQVRHSGTGVAGSLQFGAGNRVSWGIQPDGAFTPAADVQYDIGMSNAAVRTLYTGRVNITQAGEIYHYGKGFEGSPLGWTRVVFSANDFSANIRTEIGAPITTPMDLVITPMAGAILRLGAWVVQANGSLQPWTTGVSDIGAPLYMARDVHSSGFVNCMHLRAVGTVNSSGHVGIGYAFEGPNIAGGNGQGWCNAWVDASSRDFKTAITPYVNALAVVLDDTLHGVHYMHVGPTKTLGQIEAAKLEGRVEEVQIVETPQIGFVADDWLPVVPEVVAIDDDGKANGLMYGRIGAITFEGLKILAQQVATLEARIATLEATP